MAESPPNGDPSLVKQLIDEVRRLRVLAEVADTITRDISLDRQRPGFSRWHSHIATVLFSCAGMTGEAPEFSEFLTRLLG
jgi:hypothetical protein